MDPAKDFPMDPAKDFSSDFCHVQVKIEQDVNESDLIGQNID